MQKGWGMGGLTMALVSSFLIGCVRVYQATLSPLIGPCCRFTPSCSNYCIEAIKVHGLAYGLWLSLRRLLRCHPFGPSGYDPVPPRRGRKTPEKKT